MFPGRLPPAAARGVRALVDWTVVLIGAVMILLVFANVVLHVFGRTRGGHRVGELLMVWVTFLSGASAARRGAPDDDHRVHRQARRQRTRARRRSDRRAGHRPAVGAVLVRHQAGDRRLGNELTVLQIRCPSSISACRWASPRSWSGWRTTSGRSCRAGPGAALAEGVTPCSPDCCSSASSCSPRRRAAHVLAAGGDGGAIVIGNLASAETIFLSFIGGSSPSSSSPCRCSSSRRDPVVGRHRQRIVNFARRSWVPPGGSRGDGRLVPDVRGVSGSAIADTAAIGSL